MRAIPAKGDFNSPLSVTVIIVNWNGRAYLEGCLDSLRAQTHRELDILLVDNASTDDSVAFVRERYPEVRIIQAARNLGFVEGNNLALDHATGAYVALLNNDTVTDPGWLQALLDAVEPDDVAGATGKVFSLDEPDRAIFTTPLINRYSARALWSAADAPQCDVHYLSGNNLLVKRSVVDEVGPLDPGYYSYFEETDWCARMISAGYRVVYTPGAKVWHKELGSTSLDTNRYYMERNRVRFALKNFDRTYLALFVLYYLADAARRFVKGRDEFNVPLRRIIVRAVGWNLRHLPETLASRRRDYQRLKQRRSYNRSLSRVPV